MINNYYISVKYYFSYLIYLLFCNYPQYILDKDYFTMFIEKSIINYLKDNKLELVDNIKKEFFI